MMVPPIKTFVLGHEADFAQLNYRVIALYKTSEAFKDQAQDGCSWMSTDLKIIRNSIRYFKPKVGIHQAFARPHIRVLFPPIKGFQAITTMVDGC